MKTIKRLSPSSLALWESDRDQFYLKYLSDTPQWEPQTAAMVVGSAFDAFVKASLHQHLFGTFGEFNSVTELFESQVENKELRPWAWEAGKYAFDCYRTWGAYDELLEELARADEDPRFEFKLTDNVEGVPVVGYPDMWFKRDVQVVLDWKVNGFCSKHAHSPKKLYKSCRDCWGDDKGKPTRGGGDPKPHKSYEEIDHRGHKIGKHFLEDVYPRWADQIAIYSWLLGVEIGDDSMVTCIDQLCCKPNEDNTNEPFIRVAQHRCRISSDWQFALADRLKACWAQIQSGHIFDDLTREESDARCELLDMPQVDVGDEEFWADCTERQFRG